MNLIKNGLYSILALQLMVILSLLTEQAFIKLEMINSSFNIFSLKSRDYNKEITLAEVIQDRDAIKGLVDSLTEEEEIDSFKTAQEQPFFYKAYQQNRYLPLSWESEDTNSFVKEDIESKAKKFLGTRYVWAANGPNCFDCSGFTKYIYEKYGFSIPRHSGNQAQVGMKVAYNELEKGDLVFFDTNRRKTGEVNHVGIYLEDGKFIHASSGNKKVVITSFDKKRYYKSRFLWGRRLIKNRIYYAFKSPHIDNISRLISPTPTTKTILKSLSSDRVSRKILASLKKI